MTYRPRPADSLDLAIVFLTLALVLCPDEVRHGMIAVLDEQITPQDEQRFDQLLEDLQKLNNAHRAGLIDLDTLDIPPALARWLRATSDDSLSLLTTDYCNLPTEPLLLTAGGKSHETA